jgi:DUF1365 family protein
MTTITLMDDLRAECLVGGWGSRSAFTKVDVSKTSISQKNQALNLVAGVAYQASNIWNSASISNTQVNSVG